MVTRPVDSAHSLAAVPNRTVARAHRAAVRIAARSRGWIESRDAVRLRRLRARNRLPLPDLYRLHPEARHAPRRELGMRTVAVAEIVGSAVDGPAQRGSDFLPLPECRSANWKQRWRRINRAIDALQPLPPIDLVKTAEGYWVVDGHNRVAAALIGNQVAVDAAVVGVRLAGEPVERASGPLGPMLGSSRALRAAGTGMLSRGTSVAVVEADFARRMGSAA